MTAFNPEGVSDEAANLLPSEVMLYPAAPNPFNATARIRFFLPQSANVRLTVYDSAGRQVETLMDGLQTTGVGYATLRGGELATGVYLLRLEAGAVVRSQKVVLLK